MERKSTARKHSELGSSLMLVPAGMLILLILGAISVDTAIGFMGQRELQNQAAAAANDIATLALDEKSIATTGAFSQPNSEIANQLALKRLAAVDGGVVIDPNSIEVDVDGVKVTVAAVGTVEYLFAKAIPGADHKRTISVESTASLAVD